MDTLCIISAILAAKVSCVQTFQHSHPRIDSILTAFKVIINGWIKHNQIHQTNLKAENQNNPASSCPYETILKILPLPLNSFP